LAVLWTGLGAPLAILLANRSLRAYRLKRSTNGALARKVRVWGSLITYPLVILAVGFAVAQGVWLFLRWANT
jgi:hypothetical protein